MFLLEFDNFSLASLTSLSHIILNSFPQHTNIVFLSFTPDLKIVLLQLQLSQPIEHFFDLFLQFGSLQVVDVQWFSPFRQDLLLLFPLGDFTTFPLSSSLSTAARVHSCNSGFFPVLFFLFPLSFLFLFPLSLFLLLSDPHLFGSFFFPFGDSIF